MNWIMPANPNSLDHAGAFKEWGFIDWKQHPKTKFSIGDIIYLYCTSPQRKIRYKTRVEKINMPSSKCQDIRKYWRKKEQYDEDMKKAKCFVRILLLEEIDSDELSLEHLKEWGEKSHPQGPKTISDKLVENIEKCFNKHNAKGYFEDLSSEEKVIEGHKLTVQVNKYERSSVARKNAIQYHGCKCSVCGIDFEDVYGEVGKGFIHIHHKIPLHTIGSDYCVDYKEDLIPVCPNCHAMLHREENGKYLTVEELKKRINKK